MNSAVFSVTIRVFSAVVPRPRARLVMRMAITLCASTASIAASTENLHQGANIRPPLQRFDQRAETCAVPAVPPSRFSQGCWAAGHISTGMSPYPDLSSEQGAFVDRGEQGNR